MSADLFLDSNILVYAYDGHEPKKQKKAQALLKTAIQEESAVLSTQVLGEFFVVTTRRLKQPLSVSEAEKIIEILSILPVAEIDLTLVMRAIDTQKRYRISYWDSLIVATAERAGCARILSEDLNDGQRYNDVLIENPFTRS
jgi:predicted nucleic acid-binding protein